MLFGTFINTVNVSQDGHVTLHYKWSESEYKKDMVDKTYPIIPKACLPVSAIELEASRDGRVVNGEIYVHLTVKCAPPFRATVHLPDYMERMKFNLTKRHMRHILAAVARAYPHLNPSAKSISIANILVSDDPHEVSVFDILYPGIDTKEITTWWTHLDGLMYATFKQRQLIQELGRLLYMFTMGSELRTLTDLSHSDLMNHVPQTKNALIRDMLEQRISVKDALNHAWWKQ